MNDLWEKVQHSALVRSDDPDWLADQDDPDAAGRACLAITESSDIQGVPRYALMDLMDILDTMLAFSDGSDVRELEEMSDFARTLLNLN